MEWIRAANRGRKLLIDHPPRSEERKRIIAERLEHGTGEADWAQANRREMPSGQEVTLDSLPVLARYGASVERSFYRTLHELQRVQALRLGSAIPPPVAVDVDVAVSQESA